MTKQAKTLDEFLALHGECFDFDYKGYKCLIMAMPDGYLNGYVSIPRAHPAFRKEYYELDIECHGGLTFSDIGVNGWNIGFDCAHAGDLIPEFPDSTGVWRDEEYVTNELKSIVEQLIDMEQTNERGNA